MRVSCAGLEVLYGGHIGVKELRVESSPIGGRRCGKRCTNISRHCLSGGVSMAAVLESTEAWPTSLTGKWGGQEENLPLAEESTPTRACWDRAGTASVRLVDCCPKTPPTWRRGWGAVLGARAPPPLDPPPFLERFGFAWTTTDPTCSRERVESQCCLNLVDCLFSC